MWKKTIWKCCHALSFPFIKETHSTKEYHNLNGETPIIDIIHTSSSEKSTNLNSKNKVQTHKSPKKDKLKTTNTSTLQENFDLEKNEEILPQIKDSMVELTTINLENPLEKYYQMASETMELFLEKLKDSVIDFEKVFEDVKNPSKLKIFIKSRVIDKQSRVSMIRSEWLAPCPPEKLLEIMNDIEEQKRISNSNMDQFYSYENFGSLNNFNLMYLKYKKMLTASPRDFVYLKCFSLIDRAKNIWVDCSKSIKDDRFPEIKGESIRGDITVSGTYIEAFEKDGLMSSKVTSYSEIDFKLNLPLMLTKPTTVSEFKKYVEKTCEAIENRTSII